jgi:hypothetical protein
MKLRIMAAAGALVIASTVTASGAAAHSGGPPACVRYTATIGSTCFEWNGDDQWVYDRANSWRVGVQIRTDYGKVRWCVNAHGPGTWHECTFDHLEGRCVQFRLYEQYGGPTGPTRSWTNWTEPIRTSTGNPCRCTSCLRQRLSLRTER